MKIEIFSDFTCPFCYVSKTKLFSAIKELNLQEQVKIVYKAYQLSPDAAKEGEEFYKEAMLKRFNGNQKKLDEAIEAVQMHAQEAGLTYNVDAIKVANTENAHRLAKLAEQDGQADAFTERVMSGYFTHGMNLNDTETLFAICEELTIPRAEAEKVLAEQLFSEKLAADRYDAQQLQITSVPFMVFEDRYGIKGVEPIDIYLKTLRQASAMTK